VPHDAKADRRRHADRSVCSSSPSANRASGSRAAAAATARWMADGGLAEDLVGIRFCAARQPVLAPLPAALVAQAVPQPAFSAPTFTDDAPLGARGLERAVRHTLTFERQEEVVVEVEVAESVPEGERERQPGRVRERGVDWKGRRSGAAFDGQPRL
jgi:hypothetical protein